MILHIGLIVLPIKYIIINSLKPDIYVNKLGHHRIRYFSSVYRQFIIWTRADVLFPRNTPTYST